MSQTTFLAPSPPDPTASSPTQLPELGQPSPPGVGLLVTVPGSPNTWPVQTRECMDLGGHESMAVMEIKYH